MFNALSFTVRWLLSIFLVFGTYNVTGYSYYHWIVNGPSGDLALKVLIGWVMLVTFGVFSIAVWRSMGPVGISMCLFILYALVWVCVDSGLINLNNPNTVTTISQGLFATLLAVGVSLSHLKTRFTGQPEVRDVNDFGA